MSEKPRTQLDQWMIDSIEQFFEWYLEQHRDEIAGRMLEWYCKQQQQQQPEAKA